MANGYYKEEAAMTGLEIAQVSSHKSQKQSARNAVRSARVSQPFTRSVPPTKIL